MTAKNKKDNKSIKMQSMAFSSLRVDAFRTFKGMSVTVTGIIGISELSDAMVSLASHGGRIKIIGERLQTSLLENKTVELVGKIEEMIFIYD